MSKTASILVVDDEQHYLETTSGFLVDDGYQVSTASNVAEARKEIAATRFDLFVLDIVMPGTTGKVLCREIRSSSTAGIIMVSSLSDDDERVGLLEMGADDYIVKPYVGRELLARVRAVIRRLETSTRQFESGAKFGDWQFLEGDRRIRHEDGRVVTLTNSEAELMRFFVANPNVACSREDILAISRMRQHGGYGDRSVDALIVRLRKKIEDDPKNPKLIETAWGRGYTFNG